MSLLYGLGDAEVSQAARLTPDAQRRSRPTWRAYGLTERASTFTRRDVVHAWCERLPAGANAV